MPSHPTSINSAMESDDLCHRHPKPKSTLLDRNLWHGSGGLNPSTSDQSASQSASRWCLDPSENERFQVVERQCWQDFEA